MEISSSQIYWLQFSMMIHENILYVVLIYWCMCVHLCVCFHRSCSRARITPAAWSFASPWRGMISGEKDDRICMEQRSALRRRGAGPLLCADTQVRDRHKLAVRRSGKRNVAPGLQLIRKCETATRKLTDEQAAPGIRRTAHQRGGVYRARRRASELAHAGSGESPSSDQENYRCAATSNSRRRMCIWHRAAGSAGTQYRGWRRWRVSWRRASNNQSENISCSRTDQFISSKPIFAVTAAADRRLKTGSQSWPQCQERGNRRDPGDAANHKDDRHDGRSPVGR